MSASERLTEWKANPVNQPGAVAETVMIAPENLDAAEQKLRELGAVNGALDAKYKIFDLSLREGSKQIGGAVAYAKTGRINMKVTLSGKLIGTLDEFRAE